MSTFGTSYGQRSPLPTGRPRSGIPIKLILAVLIAGFALVRYWSNATPNTITGRTQHISMSVDQEIALGLQSAPQMAAQFGGESRSAQYRQIVKTIGQQIIDALPDEARDPQGRSMYPFEFHVLADPQTVNAFALPGGQIFITEALLSRLSTPGQVAGVLGHEAGHVLGRHSAQQMAKGDLMQGLVGAATVASSGGQDGGRGGQMIAAYVANMMQLKYGRDDELEADQLGLKFMSLAGYDPRSMIDVMKILEQAGGGASANRPEFSSTHPNPGNRIAHIDAWLRENFPNGIPGDLRK